MAEEIKLMKGNEAIVVENAPMGVQSASRAGIFTIAVNTGPLADEILWSEGADLVLHSMSELASVLPTLRRLWGERVASV